MIDIRELKTDEDWSFSNVSRSETLYASHGYHRYPAKFIPQLVQKAIAEYSSKGDLVADPLGGCGTTLIEAKLNARRSVGVDVNRVAVLIARAKSRSLTPDNLEIKNRKLFERIRRKKIKRGCYGKANARLRYWFKERQFNGLKKIYDCILEEKDSKTRLFYQCCFSNILKNCSIWYAKSIKPMRDPYKIEDEPLGAFTKHLKYMVKRNQEFHELLQERRVEGNGCVMRKGDARRTGLSSNTVDLIITSPPYVTSYEYADLHQLSTLWFGYADDIKDIKKGFVGTSSRKHLRNGLKNEIAEQVITKMREKSVSLAKNIQNYYVDLEKCYKEMHRILKPSKRLCLILGNTEYLGVKVPNVEVSVKTLEQLGFTVSRIIKRKLSSKIFTPYRNKSGRFTDSKHGNKRKIYQYEYVIIAQK